MRTNVAHRWVILLATIVTGWAATGGVVKGLRLPLLDAEGRPTRVLTADECNGTFDEPKLSRAAIDFFAAGKTDAAPIGRMELDAATFLRAKDLVVGDGEFRLRSVRGTVRGSGYTYDLKGNELHIRHGFELVLRGVTVTGEEADVTLVTEGGQLEIAGFEARRNVVAVAAGKTFGGYQRVRGEQATYSATDHLLHIAPPLWGVDEKGHEARVDIKEMTFRLGL
jgi:hypothetical protein